MCLFAYPNRNEKSIAFKKGIKKFECGACPECLQKKSRQWALRCSMEAKNNVGMMITLTYDTYKYDSYGNIIGENLNADMELSKRDVQNFLKRLRVKFPDKNIKYLATAERGKRTNRPHYHCLIFGLVFDDLIPYKKSKRGNAIYRSKTLEKIWHGGRGSQRGGICTVDCVNLTAATARYCTKYCAKDAGLDDTFMLFSHGIGEEELLRRFNGKNYWLEGREYAIPRKIWVKYIENKYKLKYKKNKKEYGYSRYIAPPEKEPLFEEYRKLLSYSALMRCRKERKKQNIRWLRSLNRREIYQAYRDNDVLYKRYITYWQSKVEIFEKYQPSSFLRILALPNDKYRTYKVKALEALRKKRCGKPYIPPRSRCYAEYKRLKREESPTPVHCICRYQPRHYTANDSIFEKKYCVKNKNVIFFRETEEKSPFEEKKYPKQQNFFELCLT